MTVNQKGRGKKRRKKKKKKPLFGGQHICKSTSYNDSSRWSCCHPSSIIICCISCCSPSSSIIICRINCCSPPSSIIICRLSPILNNNLSHQVVAVCCLIPASLLPAVGTGWLASCLRCCLIVDQGNFMQVGVGWCVLAHTAE